MHSAFITQLKSRLQEDLPGEQAQLQMAPLHRKPISEYKLDAATLKEGGILILLYPNGNQLSTVLTLRQDYGGQHGGQVSFPGGRVEVFDKNLYETALRETREEIGVDASKIQALGALTQLYIPVSNFLVFPYVGFVNYKPMFVPEEKEVKKIIEVDLKKLADPSIKDEKEIPLANGFSIKAPYFAIENHTVWGATAMIISEFNAVIKSL